MLDSRMYNCALPNKRLIDWRLPSCLHKTREMILIRHIPSNKLAICSAKLYRPLKFTPSASSPLYTASSPPLPYRDQTSTPRPSSPCPTRPLSAPPTAQTPHRHRHS